MWVLQAAVTLLPAMGLAAAEWVRAEQLTTTHLWTGLRTGVTEQVAPGRLEKAWVKWSPNPSAEKQTGGKKSGEKAAKVQTEGKKNQH